MKNRIISCVLTICIMSTTILFGCASPKAETENASSNDATAQAESDSPSANEASTSDAPFEAATESESEDAEDDAAKGGGGTPWINSELKENITADTVVDPKEDFHLYANKDWILANDIPDGYTSWSHYLECGLEVKKQCMELLKDESIDGHDADLIRTYNKLILDWDSRNAAGVTEIQDNFDKILAAQNIDDITALFINKDSTEQYYDFFGYGVNTGLNDPNKYIVCVSTPGLLLRDSAEYANRTELGDLYYNLRKELFEFISAKLGLSTEDASKYFDAAVELETKLSEKIYSTEDSLSDDYLDKINNEMSFDDVSALANVFPLKEILTASGYKYDGIYLVTRPDYFALLDEVYTNDNIEGIKGRILVDYALSYSGSLDKECYDKTNELINKYYGSSGTISDEEMAYNQVASALPASMQKVYIAKYGSEEDKKRMTELCQEVIDTYREMLTENTWASQEVKDYAIKKLDSIVIHAAYPDKFRDTTSIDISGCSLIEANDRITDYEIQYSKSLLGKKIDKEMWAENFNILECNAFYSPSENTINMIIGMMGEPFYSSDMSIEELYASIGAFWVGHEVSHAFDSNGAQFDAEGLYRNWWTEEDKAEFDKRIKKMDDYLDTFVAFGDHHFVGSNIDTEMAADMTGLQCALRMASKVEGFDYDKFFTKYAQMNCSLGKYSTELNQLLQDEHPLNYSRTNVPVQQFEEFYETYDVKEGDNMYLAPEDRLIIW